MWGAGHLNPAHVTGLVAGPGVVVGPKQHFAAVHPVLRMREPPHQRRSLCKRNVMGAGHLNPAHVGKQHPGAVHLPVGHGRRSLWKRNIMWGAGHLNPAHVTSLVAGPGVVVGPKQHFAAWHPVLRMREPPQ